MGIFSSGTNLAFGDSIRDDNRSAIRAQQTGLDNAKAIGDEFYGGQIDAYGQDAQNYGGDLAQWREAQTRDLPQMGSFNSELDINKHLDPYQDYVQEQEANAIEQSAAAQGGMFSGSGATAKALQDRSQQVAGQFRDRATNLAKDERQFGYNDFLNRFKQERENDALEMQGYGNLLKQSSGGRENMFGAQGGQADLGMQNAIQQGQLEGQIHTNNANYTKGMADNLGGLLEGGAELGANAFSSGMFGSSGGGAGGGGGGNTTITSSSGTHFQ